MADSGKVSDATGAGKAVVADDPGLIRRFGAVDRHLKRILSSYVDYYHSARTHLSLAKDSPDGWVVQPIEKGRVVELKRVGGLHHFYARMAA